MSDFLDDLEHQAIIEKTKAEERLGLSPYWFTTGPAKEKIIIWVTKDGENITIQDMTSIHLQLSIAKCKRDNWRIEAIPYLEAELLSRNT